MKRLLCLLSLAFLISSPGFAQYSARTDTAIVPYPTTVPSMGAAGSCIVDPGFSSTICAVSDANTDPTHPNQDFNTTNYSGLNTWNVGSTAFYFLDGQAAVWTASFNPGSGIVTNLTKNGFGDLGHAEYSFNDPSTVTGTPAYPLIKQRIGAVETTLHDPRLDYTASPIPYADDFEVSLSGTRYSLVAWPIQNLGRLVYTWDTDLGDSYVDTQTLCVSGQWGSTGPLVSQPMPNGALGPIILPFYVHQASITRNGQYMVIAPGSQSNQEVVWEIGTTKAWAFPATGPNTFGIGTGGHDGVGFDTFYDTDGVITRKWQPDYWVSVPIGSWAPITPLASTIMGGFTQYGSDYHISANEAVGPSNNSFDQNPIVLSTEYPTQPVGVGMEPQALAPYMNEIIGLCTSCATPTVWRFAHTYYDFNTQLSPCCGPTGNVSQDGNWFIFTSNWGCTRGLDKNGRCRTDVFVVNLQSAFEEKTQTKHTDGLQATDQSGSIGHATASESGCVSPSNGIRLCGKPR